MKRLLLPLLAAVVGGLVLGFAFPRVHPAANWKFQFGRDEAIEKARGLASTEGVSTAGWQVSVKSEYKRRIEHYHQLYPDDPLAKQISPLTVKVQFQQSSPPRSFAVELYPSGTISGWERNDGGPPGRRRGGRGQNPPNSKGGLAPTGGPLPGVGPSPRGGSSPGDGPPNGGPPDGPPEASRPPAMPPHLGGHPSSGPPLDIPPGGGRPEYVDAAQRIAEAAFRRIAGPDAGAYHLTTMGASTKKGIQFTWECTQHSGAFEPTVNVVVLNNAVVQAETHIAFSKEFEAVYAVRGQATDWWDIAYFVLYAAMVFSAAALYALATVRRRPVHRFAMAFTFLTLAFLIPATLLDAQKQSIEVQDGSGDTSVYAGMAVVVALTGAMAWLTAGGGLFGATGHPQPWWSLRLLLSRRLFARPVGLSIGAGALWAPTLAAIPVAVGMFDAKSHWWKLTTDEAFAPSPVLQTLQNPFSISLLAFFGIMVVLAQTRISLVWPRRAAIATAALIFFMGFDGQFTDSFGAHFLEGGLMAAAMFMLFVRFDLLAVLVAGMAKGLLLAAPVMLMQPAASLQAIGWRMLAVYAGVLAVGLIFAWKAPDIEDQEAGKWSTEVLRTQREELQTEFGIARRAQREMLPANPPLIQGMQLAAHCTPAREVGGDLYDFLPMGNDRVAIAVADVSGKGVPAALYMTLTKGLLAATTQEDLDLPLIFEHLNTHLYTVGRRKTFVTMVVGVLDPVDRTLEYARAGHNPIVWHRARTGTAALVTSSGMGLGINSGKVFCRTLAVEKLQLESGDLLVFYSDGLTEAMNPELEQFGEDRLLEVVERSGDLSAAAARDAILNEVTTFLAGNHPQDDLTLVVLRVA